MAFKQSYNPNINIGAIRGWCLKYIDDAGQAPARTPNAMAAANNESRAGRLRQGDLPVGIWVVIYFNFAAGPYVGLGHVAFARRNQDGSVEIHDSEVHSGARGVYRSIAEITAWFGKYKPLYLGWSTHCDGRQYAEQVADAPTGKKSNDEIATEVIAGRWGNGAERQHRLSEAGYNASEIQAIVNQRLGAGSTGGKKTNEAVAREVIRGDWGNGAVRKNRLTAAGYNAAEIQRLVNQMV